MTCTDYYEFKLRYGTGNMQILLHVTARQNFIQERGRKGEGEGVRQAGKQRGKQGDRK